MSDGVRNADELRQVELVNAWLARQAVKAAQKAAALAAEVEAAQAKAAAVAAAQAAHARRPGLERYTWPRGPLAGVTIIAVAGDPDALARELARIAADPTLALLATVPYRTRAQTEAVLVLTQAAAAQQSPSERSNACG
jgi:hypothetical protein